METKNNMGVFSEIFNACTELETLYETKSRNPIKNWIDDRNIKRCYDNMHNQISKIKDNYIPERLFNGYLDCLGSSMSSYGTCKKIFKNREVYIASFEFNMFEQKNSKYAVQVVVDVAQVINGGFGHIILTKFHIIRNGAAIDSFSINYNDIVSQREDEVDFSGDKDKGTIKFEHAVMKEFLYRIQSDIFNYLKEFIDGSKERLERKRGTDNAKRGPSKGKSVH